MQPLANSDITAFANRTAPSSGAVWFCLTLLLLSTFSGCQNIHDPNAPYPNWQIPKAHRFSFYPLYSGKDILLAARCGNRDCIKSINTYDGTTNWEFADRSLHGLFYNAIPFLNDQYVVFPNGKELLCIDLKTGQLQWSKRMPWDGDDRVFGVKNRIYRAYNSNAKHKMLIYEFEIETGNSRLLFERPYEAKALAIMRSPVPINNGQLLTAFTSFIPSTKQGSSLYLLSDSVKVYSHELYPPNKNGIGATKAPLVEGNTSFWIAGRFIICFDLAQRAELWRTELPQGLLTSRLAKNKDNIFAAAEDEWLYAINKSSGKIAWKCKIAGTPSRAHIVQDTLFVVGGADKALYKINAQTGTLIGVYRSRLGPPLIEREASFNTKTATISDGEFWYTFKLSEWDKVLEQAKKAF